MIQLASRSHLCWQKLVFSRKINNLLKNAGYVITSVSHSSFPNVFPYVALQHGEKLAIKDNSSVHTYSDLCRLSYQLQEHICNGQSCLSGRVAFLTPNNASYVISQWAIWLCDAIAVPLCPSHPTVELEYVLNNSESSLLIAHPQYEKVAESLSNSTGIQRFVLPTNCSEWNEVRNSHDDVSDQFGEKLANRSNEEMLQRPAMLIYTSGTTGRPKGVLLKHNNVMAQTEKMVSEWCWSASDNILHVLPLHHTHGIVNALLCPLLVGATVTMHTSFDAEKVWNCFLKASSADAEDVITVFMAVPTIYAKLIQFFDQNSMSEEETRKSCSALRLMVSGSAALPTSVLARWRDVTGHVLLERYGMTEYGMALTNPYHGTRVAGSVGLPFDDVTVKLVATDDSGNADFKRELVVARGKEVELLTDDAEGQLGELLVQTPAMFARYWNNPSATSETFHQGWFKTGDTCMYKNGTFWIVGRSSVDIIKSGGYKIGALDVEAALLENPLVDEVAVVGVPDPVWGQVVAAVVKLSSDDDVGDDVISERLTAWCRERMARYRVPRSFRFVDRIPRNAMGKVNKKGLLRDLFGAP